MKLNTANIYIWKLHNFWLRFAGKNVLQFKIFLMELNLLTIFTRIYLYKKI